MSDIQTIILAVMVSASILYSATMICNSIRRTNRELDRIACSLFNVSGDIEKIKRGVK